MLIVLIFTQPRLLGSIFGVPGVHYWGGNKNGDLEQHVIYEETEGGRRDNQLWASICRAPKGNQLCLHSLRQFRKHQTKTVLFPISACIVSWKPRIDFRKRHLPIVSLVQGHFRRKLDIGHCEMQPQESTNRRQRINITRKVRIATGCSCASTGVCVSINYSISTEYTWRIIQMLKQHHGCAIVADMHSRLARIRTSLTNCYTSVEAPESRRNNEGLLRSSSTDRLARGLALVGSTLIGSNWVELVSGSSAPRKDKPYTRLIVRDVVERQSRQMRTIRLDWQLCACQAGIKTRQCRQPRLTSMATGIAAVTAAATIASAARLTVTTVTTSGLPRLLTQSAQMRLQQRPSLLMLAPIRV